MTKQVTVQSEVLTALRARTAFASLISCDLTDCQLTQSLPGSAVWLPTGPRVHRFLSRYLAQYFGLNDENLALDSVDPATNAILLLPTPRLMRFTRHLGAILAAAEVRHAISRADVAAYRSALGDELYDFQMERALLLGAPASADQRFGPEHISEAIDASGYIGLQYFIANTHPDLWSRLRLKLPVEWSLLPDAGISLPPHQTLCNIVRRLFRELEA